MITWWYIQLLFWFRSYIQEGRHHRRSFKIEPYDNYMLSTYSEDKLHRSVELADVWKYLKSSRDIKRNVFIVTLMTDTPHYTYDWHPTLHLWLTSHITRKHICVVCNKQVFFYMFVHVCCICPGTRALQEAWWDMMIEHFNLDFVCWNKSIRQRAKIPNLDYEKFLKLCHCHLIYCITEYNRNVSSISSRTYITWHISVFIYFCIILHRLLYLFICNFSYNSS